MARQLNLITTQLEDAIREAEEQAETRLKMTLPDDPDYFDYFRQYDEANNVEQLLALDQHLDPYAPNISVVDRVKRIAYPKNTNAGVKVDQGDRNFTAVKRWVKENHPEPAKRWSKCHDFFEKRHSIFVREKLKGMPLQTYESMGIVAREKYRTLHGFQKTNFVISMIADRCFVGANQERQLAQQRFYSYTQRNNQTAGDYVNFLEGHRSSLRKSVVFISDEDLKVKLMTTLNLNYTEATHLYDYDKATLEEVKRKLAEVDNFMQRKRASRRNPREQSGNQSGDPAKQPRNRDDRRSRRDRSRERKPREDRRKNRDDRSRNNRDPRRRRRERSRSRSRNPRRTPFVSDEVYQYVANKIQRRNERRQERQQEDQSRSKDDAPQNNGSNGNKRKCYLCGKRGHTEENCNSRSRNGQKKDRKPIAPVASVDDDGSISDSTDYTSLSSYSESGNETD